METYKRKTHYQDKGVAETYMESRFSHPKGERENAEVAQALDHALHSIPGVETILDMPCGSGRFADFFYGKGYRYCGADVSLEMISVLAKEQKEKDRAPLLVRCEGEALPFKDEVFDCVVCIRFLHHHMPDSVRVTILKEMRRVSRHWLIVQSQRLWFLGFGTIFKTSMRKLFGRKVRKHRFYRETINAGWNAEKRLWTRSVSRYLEIYKKT